MTRLCVACRLDSLLDHATRTARQMHLWSATEVFMGLENIDRIVQHEIEVRRRDHFHLAAFVIAVLIVIASLLDL